MIAVSERAWETAEVGRKEAVPVKCGPESMGIKCPANCARRDCLTKLLQLTELTFATLSFDLFQVIQGQGHASDLR